MESGRGDEDVEERMAARASLRSFLREVDQLAQQPRQPRRAAQRIDFDLIGSVEAQYASLLHLPPCPCPPTLPCFSALHLPSSSLQSRFSISSIRDGEHLETRVIIRSTSSAKLKRSREVPLEGGGAAGDERGHGSLLLHYRRCSGLTYFSLDIIIDDEDDDAEPGEATGGDERPTKRRRVTRKASPWIFVDRPGEGEGDLVTCRLGCLNIKRDGLFRYSTKNTSHVIRHVEAKHPQFITKYRKAQNNEYSFDELEKEALQQKAASLTELEKMKNNFAKFLRKANNLDKKVEADLVLLCWSIANGISRNSLNDTIFDYFLRLSGSTAAANRHDLQTLYLPQLDSFVKREILQHLKSVRSVAVSSDGWRDSARRNWLDLGLAWVSEVDGGSRWQIDMVDADLIYLPSEISGDIIETVVRNSVDEFVPADCLLATSTNDGAGDEQKAAFQLVQEGNTFWCAAHRVQLAIGDCLDSKKARPPVDCAPHRAVLRKAHDCVVFVNAHRDATARFKELAKTKRENQEGAKAWEQLVLDNDTRWDTDLMLLERIVYFDEELRELYLDGALGMPPECVLTLEEFDLVRGITLVLNPFRDFTKFVQFRNKITVAHVPQKLDDLLASIQPGMFDAGLEGSAPIIFPQLRDFQVRLIASMRARFDPIFQSGSLALAARYFLPGGGAFNFAYFNVDATVTDALIENLLDDFVTLLPSTTGPEETQEHRAIAEATLPVARRALDRLDNNVDLLSWWPQQKHLAALFPLVKMLYAIPASSADNERAFSSASYTLGPRRTRLDLEAFRSEHRIRRFIVAGNDGGSHAGRIQRLERVRDLLRHYTDLVAQ